MSIQSKLRRSWRLAFDHAAFLIGAVLEIPFVLIDVAIVVVETAFILGSLGLICIAVFLGALQIVEFLSTINLW